MKQMTKVFLGYLELIGFVGLFLAGVFISDYHKSTKETIALLMIVIGIIGTLVTIFWMDKLMFFSGGKE